MNMIDETEAEKWQRRCYVATFLLIGVTLILIVMISNYNELQHENYNNTEELHCLNGHDPYLEKAEQQKCLKDLYDKQKASKKWF